MVRIIKNGKYRSTSCSCGCEYSFDTTDIVDEQVACPECGTLNHVNTIEVVTNSTTIRIPTIEEFNSISETDGGKTL